MVSHVQNYKVVQTEEKIHRLQMKLKLMIQTFKLQHRKSLHCVESLDNKYKHNIFALNTPFKAIIFCIISHQFMPSCPNSPTSCSPGTGWLLQSDLFSASWCVQPQELNASTLGEVEKNQILYAYL